MAAKDIDAFATAFRKVANLEERDKFHIHLLATYLEPYLSEIVDAFYVQLADVPATAKIIEGRVERLKKTQVEWLNYILTAEWDEVFIERQLRIGQVHVDAKIPPLYVSAAMAFLTSAMTHKVHVLNLEHPEVDLLKSLESVLKLLFFCQQLIDHSYNQERLRRLTGVTGMSSALLEKLIEIN